MVLLVFAFLSIVATLPVDHPDRVTNFPGAPSEPSFPLYSGYLDVTDSGIQQRIFYVLAEAIHSDPLESPLIVWLNGGPGASSLIGFLLEHGPFLIDADAGDLRYNDFSWNQYANVLYLESPSGVGFSHSIDGDHVSYEDVTTGRVNRKALQDFMTRVHPRYAGRDFYLAGESYAGAYIPYFTREILKHMRTGEFGNSNFKGIAMGNAAVDYFSNNYAASLQLYSMGMIPEKYGKRLFDLWDRLLNGRLNSRNAEREVAGLNDYGRIGPNGQYNLQLQCNRKENATVWHIAPPVSNAQCEVERLLGTYMNREDVQISLHARTMEEPNLNWRVISYPVISRYHQDADTIPIYKDVIATAPAGFRILFYTGDMDLVCPPLQVAFGARRIAEQNNLTIHLEAPDYWRYLDDFGGMLTSYRNDGLSMDVLTVRGAGHMVPMTHPDRAFQLINNFISADASGPIDYSEMIRRRQS